MRKLQMKFHKIFGDMHAIITVYINDVDNLLFFSSWNTGKLFFVSYNIDEKGIQILINN